MTYSATQKQLTHLIQSVYDALQQTKGVLATGGSTTTFVDTTLSDDIQDDDFNGQVAIVEYDAGGAGAAPEGEIRTISDYVASTWTGTVSTAYSAAVAANDRVLVCNTAIYPLNDVIRLCNKALQKMGRFPQVDSTSLDGLAATTVYALPHWIKGRGNTKRGISVGTISCGFAAYTCCVETIPRRRRSH